jgi:hypothetical protein
MNRQNLFSDAWDGGDEEAGTRHRIFWRPDEGQGIAATAKLTYRAADLFEQVHMVGRI